MIKAVWTGPERLEIVEDRTEKHLVDHDQVRLRIRAAGVCGTDVHIWEGRLSFASPPLVLGHEFAGVVEECGRSVQTVKPGDRVKCDSVAGCGVCSWCQKGATQFCPHGWEFGITRDGGWTEYLVVPERNLHLIPLSINDEVAAIFDVEVFSALLRAGIGKGDAVVVLGAGPAGLIGLQCARVLGAGRVIVGDVLPERLSLARKLGADDTVNVSECDLLTEVNRITNNQGGDVVFEASGAEQAALDAVRILRPQGKAVFYGVLDRPIRSFPMQTVVLKNLTLCGSLPNRTGWRELFDLVGSGKIDLASLITDRFPLERAAEALPAMRDRRNGAIKAVLTMG